MEWSHSAPHDSGACLRVHIVEPGTATVRLCVSILTLNPNKQSSLWVCAQERTTWSGATQHPVTAVPACACTSWSQATQVPARAHQIGRASCRERVYTKV